MKHRIRRLRRRLSALALVLVLIPLRSLVAQEQAVPAAPPVSAAGAGAAKSNYDLLAAELKRIIQTQALDPARVGAYVKQCDCPIVVFEQNSTVGFLPGSTQKIVTTAAALDLLGPDFTYKTSVELSGNLAKDAVVGNLIVRGAGDPTIGSEFGVNPGDPTAVFRQWAAAIKATGIDRIRGLVIGDDNYFDDQLEASAWPLQDRGEAYMAQISALSFNDNCITILFRTGRWSGRLASTLVIPDSDYYRFHNEVFAGVKGEPAQVTLRREKDSNLINASGKLPPKTEYTAQASIHNPTLYFATVLRQTLMREGIIVEGEAVDIDMLKNKAAVSTGTWPVTVRISPPLAEIIKTTNRFGQNFYAEMLVKTLGKVRNGEGSFAAGCSAVHGFLDDGGVDDPTAVLLDGSGLSRGDSLSPRFLGELLAFMARHRNAAVYQESLCQPGRFGLLERRFAAARNSDSAGAERIRAATGCVLGNYSLAGYATTSAGARFAFAFMINDPRIEQTRACELLDSLAAALAVSPIEANP
jgi:D-alanyl-D-alanine carboxypeptidase/D-alanyl-D-alanine-endopeptidase (penicillin-binding protein 4)